MEFSCPECGAVLTANDAMAGFDIECPQCRATIVVPTHAAARQATTCRECGEPLPPGDVLCGNCGLNLRTGVKANEVGEGHADIGWAKPTRIVVASAVCVALAVAWVRGFSDSQGRIRKHDYLSVGILIGGSVLLVAILLGTFVRVCVGRDEDGRWTITRHRHVGFIRFRVSSVAVADCDTILIGRTSGCLSDAELAIAWLLGCAAALPGLIWAYFARRSDKCLLAVGVRFDEASQLILTRGGRERHFEAVITMLKRATGLRVWRVGTM